MVQIPSNSQTKDRSRPGQLASDLQGTEDEGEVQEKKGDDVAWADSLTNVSVGDLLSDANSQNGSAWPGIPLSCDSFDTAIAGFLSRNQSPPMASIFDAEETCDEFSFKVIIL